MHSEKNLEETNENSSDTKVRENKDQELYKPSEHHPGLPINNKLYMCICKIESLRLLHLQCLNNSINSTRQNAYTVIWHKLTNAGWLPYVIIMFIEFLLQVRCLNWPQSLRMLGLGIVYRLTQHQSGLPIINLDSNLIQVAQLPPVISQVS